jgi:hypothetical protein
MILFRPTLKLAKRLHVALPPGEAPLVNPFTDWCAHSFTAERYRYVIVTNTHSLFSVVMHGAGITADDAFIRRALDTIREVLCDSGREFAWERHIEPATGTVRFARFSDRRVMGSMNDLIFLARTHLIEGGLSPFDTAAEINSAPMSVLWKRGEASLPDPAFDEMTRVHER